ncbi:hypothetical protein [Haloarchaeobius sp. HRN-SO-5]|uniref:hypothetical protein n=1 Tax=Haloarchaeobius sp. HRN-SO-5 TaxID=3446118 RepID=UPI003EBDD2B4
MSYLVGISSVMAVFLIAVAVAVTRRRGWYNYAPDIGGGTSMVQDLAGNPVVWTLSFLLVVGGLLGGVVVFVSGTPQQQAFGGALLAVLGGLLFVGYIAFGTYHSSRSRGLTSAVSAMVSAWALGSLLVLAITASLLIG